MKILLISPMPPPYGGIASWTKKFLRRNRQRIMKFMTNMSRYYQGLSNKNVKKCLTCVSKTNILAVRVLCEAEAGRKSFKKRNGLFVL